MENLNNYVTEPSKQVFGSIIYQKNVSEVKDLYILQSFEGDLIISSDENLIEGKQYVNALILKIGDIKEGENINIVPSQVNNKKGALFILSDEEMENLSGPSNLKPNIVTDNEKYFGIPTNHHHILNNDSYIPNYSNSKKEELLNELELIFPNHKYQNTLDNSRLVIPTVEEDLIITNKHPKYDSLIKHFSLEEKIDNPLTKEQFKEIKDILYSKNINNKNNNTNNTVNKGI